MKRFPILLIFMMTLSGVAYAGWEEGLTAFKAGRYEEAVREFKSVADAQPDWPGSYLMMGQAYLKLGRGTEAVNAIKKAYDLDPNDDNTKVALGQAYVTARKYSDAARLLRTVNTGNLKGEKKSAYHQLMAVAMSKSGQSGQAIAALKQAASSRPNDANLQFDLGRTALAAGETATAVQALEKAVSLDGNDSKKKESLVKALIRQGREKKGAQKKGSYERAVRFAKDLARSGSFEHLLTLGEAQLGAKAYSDAVGSFDRASAKQSGDWLAPYYKGQALTSLKQYGPAESSLRTSLNKTSERKNQQKIYKQLAFVYEKQRKFDQAISTYQQAGDQAGAARVLKNKETEAENKLIEEQNKEIEAMKKAAAEIDAQLEGLEPD